jgi:ketosteroid isomerase-like protein
MPSNLDVVKAWVEACNQMDVERALSLCSPCIELTESKTLPGSVRAVGLDKVRRYLERFTTHWSEGEWLPQEFLESGDKIVMVARLKLRGRQSGIEVDRSWVYVFTVRDGKLLRQEGFDERAEGLAAAGVQ